VSVVELVRPRVMHVPACDTSIGREAVELAAAAGLVLDPWQALVLEHSLGRRVDRKWAAFEVGVNVPRQNGKDALLEARELVGLFLLGERLIIHTAHLFSTAKEHFLRLVNLVESNEEFSGRVKQVIRRGGEEAILLKSGARILFKTRGRSSGRGFSGDLVVLNEAMVLQDEMLGDLVPTMSARPNPQLWYAGSAADQTVHDWATVWARVRERGLAGVDGRLAYFEWAAEGDNPDLVDVTDERLWAEANPALGIRISGEHVHAELGALDRRTFAVERLGVGDYPRTDGLESSVINPDVWAHLENPDSRIVGSVCLAFDVAYDRSYASIAAAGRNQDGDWHVEIGEHRRGVGWLPERIEQLRDKLTPDVIVCDAYSLPAGVEDVVTLNTGEHARACNQLVDLVAEKRLRHLGSQELFSAVKGARTRQLQDGWLWTRKNSQVDISPLVAATLALWAAAGEARDTDWTIHF
jgi:hypothetical protein